MTDPRSLGPADLLRWTIGSVAQEHVTVEMFLRMVWSGVAPEALRAKVPSGIGHLFELFDKQPWGASLPPEVRTAVADVVAQVRPASALRDRVVHDAWGVPAGGRPGWRRINPRTLTTGTLITPSDQQDADACLTALRRCQGHLMALVELVHLYVPIHAGERRGDPVEVLDKLRSRLG